MLVRDVMTQRGVEIVAVMRSEDFAGTLAARDVVRACASGSDMPRFASAIS